jgi:hypothetical protein
MRCHRQRIGRLIPQMKKICIHQPDFAPYLGFFDRLFDCDVYIVFDDVQFLRRGWHHRDKIKTNEGPVWLTLPIKKADRSALISEIELDPDMDSWIPKQFNLLHEGYKSSPYFDRYFPALKEIYQRGHRRLIDFNMDILEYFIDELNIEIEIVKSSDLDVPGNKNEKLIGLVRAIGGEHYITGTGSTDYIDAEKFKAAGITCEVREFAHPVYPQLFGDFIPFLSCIDAFMNCGPSLGDIIQQSNTKNLSEV